jgi:antitoxin component YwqK of YwqJK toxin-antitoxin module
MFRLSLATLFIIFSMVLFGQDTVNIKDSKGLRQGYWRKVDTAGQLIYEGKFRDGIPVGEFRYYYGNGKLKTVSRVSDKGKRAVTISYFPNGKKMAVGNYLDEKKDSTWQFYSELNGTLVSLDNYKGGLLEGVSNIFYPEGGLSELLNYRHGVRDGLWEQYYQDGKLKLRGTYKTGEKEGQFTAFYNSGQPMITGQYSLGHQDGKWVYFDEKGIVTKTEMYDKGRVISVTPPPK